MTGSPFFPTLHSRLMALPILVILPMVGVTAYTMTEWRQHELSENQAYAAEMVRHVSSVYTRQVESARDLLHAAAPLAADLPHTEAVLRAFLNATLEGSAYTNLGVLDSSGRVLLSVRTVPGGSDLARRAFFRDAVEARALSYDYEIEGRSGNARVTFASPVMDAAGRTQQVTFAVMDLRWLRGFGSDSVLPRGTILTVFDEEGTVVAQQPPAERWVGRSARGELVIDAALRVTDAGTIRGVAFDGVSRIFAFRPLTEATGRRRLYVSIGIPKDVATAPTDAVLRRTAVAFGLSLALAFVVTSVGADLLVGRHIRALAHAARRLSSGEMDVRVGTPRGAEEISQLASAFNHMAGAVQVREENLAAQERRFSALIENSSEGIALRDEPGKLVYVSPSTARILGHLPEEVVGLDADEFIHPDDLEPMRARLAEVVAAPRRTISAMFRLRHKDGRYRWIASQLQNLLDDPSVGAIVGNYRDITSWREAQEELRRAQDELESRVQQRTAELKNLSRVIEQTADSVFVTDREGTIEYVNPAFEELTGYTRAEAIGATPRLFASGLHDVKFFEKLWQTILSGGVYRTVVTNKTKDGRLYDEDQTITPIRDDGGGITHFVSTGRDITQRKRMQEALRRLNTMLEQETTRIANLLHDEAGQFLTSAHITLADVARGLPPETRERLEEVRGHLDRVEEQLRLLSRALHPRILDDLGLVGAIRFRADAFGRRTGVAVTIDAPADCECSPAVRTVIYRLVQEALNNIGKYARARHVSIALASEGGKASCSIRDDGAGFDVAAVLARGGEPSLGLRGMRDRVEAVGGTFDIVSSPGAGTDVRASLPLEVWDVGANPPC